MEDAETYDAYLVPAIFEPWSRELIKRAQVWKGDRVLDVACGTGIVACRIASSGAQVTGLDVDAERLALARRRAAEESVGVTWREGTGEALPFRAPAFELVTCQQGLQFMSDRARAAREMRRVIVPGGRAVVACWTSLEHQGAYAALAPPDTERTRSLDPDALQQLLTSAGFFAVQVETVTRQVRVPDPARFVRVALAWLTGSAPDDEAVGAGLAKVAAFVVEDHVQFTMQSSIAVARVKT